MKPQEAKNHLIRLQRFFLENSLDPTVKADITETINNLIWQVNLLDKNKKK